VAVRAWRRCWRYGPVAEGLSNAEIAERLTIAEKTVKHQMTQVLAKLDARSRVEAALIGYKAGLGRRVEPEP
jgi:DNA-binding NarL/FixJ family response regulator